MSAPEPSWVGDLRARLAGAPVGGTLRHVASAPSTNDLARAWLDEGGPDGLAILADAQTRGRGRRGRTWSSPPGLGLYLSVGLRPELAGPRAAWLTLLGAVAAAEAMRAHGVAAEIRWPNDLDAGGRKIGGVLCESRLEDGVVTSAVLGIGLNLSQTADDFPPDVAGLATSVRMERGRALPAGEMAAVILGRLGVWYRALGPALVDRWRELSPGQEGTTVHVEGEGESFRGVTRGIEADGGLRVEHADGRVTVVRVGELRRVRSAAG